MYSPVYVFFVFWYGCLYPNVRYVRWCPASTVFVIHWMGRNAFLDHDSIFLPGPRFAPSHSESGIGRHYLIITTTSTLTTVTSWLTTWRMRCLCVIQQVGCEVKTSCRQETAWVGACMIVWSMLPIFWPFALNDSKWPMRIFLLNISKRMTHTQDRD